MINVTKTFLPPLSEYSKLLEKPWSTAWMTNRGELVKELEEKIKERLGLQEFLFVNNGTIAIQIAIRALGLSGEIITTPFSYVATTSTIVWENCCPVFADIDEEDLNIDPNCIEALIGPNTCAILATHVYGNPCKVEAIEAIAVKHGLKVIYDAAHAYGVQYKGKSLFLAGDISTTSFHATKLFHTGEGGGIFCKDADLFNTIFYMHNFGHKGPESFQGLGVNAKTNELSAAMGLAVLPYIPDIIAARKTISESYDASLNFTALRRPKLMTDTEYNYAYYPVIFKNEKSLLAVKQALSDQQINARRYFYPSLNLLPYVNRGECPVSEDISTRVLCLPLYYDLDLKDASRIAEIVNANL